MARFARCEMRPCIAPWHATNNGTYLYGRQWADEEKILETKNLSESTICCFGDSTTRGDNGCGAGGNDISWTSHLGALLGGAVVENFGIKGSRIAI